MNEPSPIPPAADDDLDAPLIAPDAVERLLPGGASESLTPDADLLDPSDYAAFYGFDTHPFADALRPDLYFRTEAQDAALGALRLAVRDGMSVALVTGPSGSGKSLLSQLALRGFDRARVEPALILVSPGMGKTALLKLLAAELGLPLPERPTPAQDLLHAIHQRVLALYSEGRRAVVVVDECHFLTADSLHMIRTLTNLETESEKLVTVLLFGESAFARRLRHPRYASLQSRIVLRHALAPMDRRDVEQYVKFRVMMAGRLDPLFAPDTFDPLYEATGGIPRRINACCTRALIAGAARRAPIIDAALIRGADAP